MASGSALLPCAFVASRMVSDHGPVAAAAPWFVTIQVSVTGWPEKPFVVGRMLATAKSGSGGWLIVTGLLKRELLNSLSSGN